MVKRSKYTREGSPELFQNILKIAGMILEIIQVSGEYFFESLASFYAQDNTLTKWYFPCFAAFESSNEDWLYVKRIDCFGFFYPGKVLKV